MIPHSSSPAILGHVDVITAGQGRPLALAHGAGGTVDANFSVVLSELSPHRFMVGANYPGSGMSPPVDGALSLDGLADALVAAMLREGHQRFPIVGVSLGCAVAITAAIRHPEHVTGLALSVGFAATDENLHQAVEVYQALVDHEQWLPLARFLLLACSSPATLAMLRDLGSPTVAEGLDPVFAMGSAPQLQLAGSVDVREYAASLDLPAQVYVSGQDRLVLPASTHALGQLIPNSSTITYPEAGHIYTPEEERVWARDLHAFLAEHDL